MSSPRFSLFAVVLLSMGLGSCSSKKSEASALEVSSILVQSEDGSGAPVQYDANSLSYEVRATFSARGTLPSGGLQPLERGVDYSIELFLDGEPIDSESLISEADLNSDLYYSLVLDASYSMVIDHSPPAFEPMLGAARSNLERAISRWTEREGSTIYYSWVWFDDYIFDPYSSSHYEPANISRIPTPEGGNFTRLFGAVDFMIDRHIDAFRSGKANGPNDRHVMIVFTDGQDNRSHIVGSQVKQYQSTPFPHEKIRPTNAVTGVGDLEARLATEPGLNLTVHTIGLGSTRIDDSALNESTGIASLGRNGVYVKRPNTGDLKDLFEEVNRQVLSIEVVGARLPSLISGQAFSFKIRVRSLANESVFGDLDLQLTAP
ncbi:MAG: VWA domain-containing protein [Planctomycetes bacterium]|nr:VWA domain-containing protein [Planctomycetota bacterium]